MRKKIFCSAITQKGNRCRMAVVPGETLCRCHHPDHAAAFHARNQRGKQAYWERYRIAKALAKAGKAA